MDDSAFLDLAIGLAREALHDGDGGPFGAVVAREGGILGRGRNRVLATHDPTAHAEVRAIRNACRALGTHDLSGATIYASSEPCPMCLGAIYWAGIARVVYAADRTAAAAIGFADADLYEEIARRPERRRLRTERVPKEEAEAVLVAWKKGGGTLY